MAQELLGLSNSRVYLPPSPCFPKTSAPSGSTEQDRCCPGTGGPRGLAAGDGPERRGSAGGEGHVGHRSLLPLQIVQLGLTSPLTLERDLLCFSKHLSVEYIICPLFVLGLGTKGLV